MAEAIITKRALGEALIELCVTKPFNKITVLDITRHVGLYRQTFYYHFVDKYELLAWVYHETAFHFLDSSQLDLENWERQTDKMLLAVKYNSEFFYNTVTSDQSVLMQSFTQIIEARFTDLFELLDPHDKIAVADKKFYAHFFAFGCSGVLLDWINSHYQANPHTVAQQLSRMAKDTEGFSLQLKK